MKNLRIVLSIFFCVFVAQMLYAQKTVKYDLPAFTEISLKSDAKLILTQDSVQSVTVKAKEETLGKLIVEVSNRKLIIRYPGNVWFDSKWAPGEVHVTVSMPQIDALSQSGSGSIIAEELITSRILDLYVGGSGSIRLDDLKVEKISSTLSGSGTLQLAGDGVISEWKMIVSGSGDVKASGLETKKINVVISGSGSCSVHATENLVCKIAGSGGVTYIGNPTIESTIVGSGTVKEAR
ncbi:MAG TPA: head GIN domain-containing protein [Prolixibacteraceae bacterium]|nr:head GIN domain-containing protein [Prolixibacteraceae bacterium]